jgi:GT2 family glycosyltransferase/Flp pilus assembly protein TadD
LAQVTNETAWEVVVIDNASTDETPRFLKSLGGDVCVIRNEENVGFAKACNQGAQAARGRYLVFLNNDTIPLEGWLKALVDEVEANPDVAVVGSKLLYPNDTVQHAGVVFSRAGSIPYHLYNGFPGNVSAVNRRRELQAVTGACMLVRRAVFEAIGGFDEEYRNGFEDIDFCLKVRDRGERIIYQPKSILYHLESQTPGRKDYDAENMQRFLERWKDRWLADEDSVYVPDGYAIHEVQEDSRRIYRVANLEDAQALARWKLVAEVERQSQVGNMEAVRSSLAQPDLWPDDPGVLRWAAQICDRADVPARAEAFWRRALDFGVTPEVLVALTRNALEKGALDEAEQHIQGLITQNPTDGEGWLLQGILALQRQDFVTAKVAFENALRSSNNPRKARKGLGMATMGLNQMETAWDMFATVLADEIDDAETIHSLLRVGTALERWEPLAEHLAKYLKLNPGELSVRFALAGVHTRLGNMGAARQEYDTIRMLNPTFEGLDDLAMVLGCMPDVQAPLVNLLNAS